MKMVVFFIPILLKFVPSKNKPGRGQLMAWCDQTTIHCLDNDDPVHWCIYRQAHDCRMVAAEPIPKSNLTHCELDEYEL